VESGHSSSHIQGHGHSLWSEVGAKIVRNLETKVQASLCSQVKNSNRRYTIFWTRYKHPLFTLKWGIQHSFWSEVRSRMYPKLRNLYAGTFRSEEWDKIVTGCTQSLKKINTVLNLIWETSEGTPKLWT